MCIYIHVCSENVSKTTGATHFTVRNYVQLREGIVHHTENNVFGCMCTWTGTLTFIINFLKGAAKVIAMLWN